MKTAAAKKTAAKPTPAELLVIAQTRAAAASAEFCKGVCPACGGKGCYACLKRWFLRDLRKAEARIVNAARKAAKESTQKECQICERNQCLSASGKMVLHGYTRPGYGFIQGSCFGVGHVDYSVGTDALSLYADSLRGMLVSAEAYLLRFTNGEVTHFETESHEYVKDERGCYVYRGRNRETVRVYTSWAPGVSDADLYARHLKAKHTAAASSVEQIQGELARVERRISAWKPAKKAGK